MVNYNIGDIVYATNCYADCTIGKLLEIKDDSLIIDSSWNFNSNIISLLSYGDEFKVKICKPVSHIYKFIFNKLYKFIFYIDMYRYFFTKEIIPNKHFETILNWFYNKNETIYCN